MKKFFLATITFSVFLLSITSCSATVPYDVYEQLQQEYDELQNNYDELSASFETFKEDSNSEYEQLKEEYDSLEYNSSLELDYYEILCRKHKLPTYDEATGVPSDVN